MHRISLYPHQEDALTRIHNGCILWGGVGTGKSLTAVAYYLKKEAPKDIYVITTANKRDKLEWEAEFVKFGVGTQPGATTAGTLLVDSWNNIKKYRKVVDAFFIFDEQRLVGSGAWVGSFLRIARRNRWILLSATPGDTWMDYVPIFIANGFYDNRTDFKTQHVIYKPYSKYPKIDRYVGVGRLVKLRNSILVEMPYHRNTIRHIEHIPVEYDEERYEWTRKHRKHPETGVPLRNAAELFLALRRIVNSNHTRLQAIHTLMTKHPRLIVFYNFDHELMVLRSLSSASGITVSEYNGHHHDPIPQTDRWVYLVQYSAGAEGWNCTATDAMAFYSLPYSYKLWEQAFGRIDRLNTQFTDIWYYIFLSSAKLDRAIIKCLEAKKSFQESAHQLT